MNLKRRNNRDYFENLDFNLVSDNKIFWNPENFNNITITKGRIVIADDGKRTNTFNNTLIIKIIVIPVNEDLLENIKNIDSTILATTEKYKRHLDVLEIK